MTYKSHVTILYTVGTCASIVMTIYSIPIAMLILIGTLVEAYLALQKSPKVRR